MIDDPAPSARRGFLGRLALLTAPIAGARFSAHVGPDAAAVQSGTLDDAWLRRLTGKHRTMFDLEKHRNGHGLGQAASMLEVWRRDYRMEPPRVNIVVGARGTGIPILLADSLWAQYQLGELYEVFRPGTKDAYDVNPFSARNVQPGGLSAAEQTVESLQRRGVLFLACRNTIAAASRRLSAGGFGPAEDVQRTIEGALLPGVVLVPAMLVAFTQMQEKGVSYVYAG
jgi:intracellular sulfur oxidation DsrE/DsrF family protein